MPAVQTANSTEKNRTRRQISIETVPFEFQIKNTWEKLSGVPMMTKDSMILSWKISQIIRKWFIFICIDYILRIEILFLSASVLNKSSSITISYSEKALQKWVRCSFWYDCDFDRSKLPGYYVANQLSLEWNGIWSWSQIWIDDSVLKRWSKYRYF